MSVVAGQRKIVGLSCVMYVTSAKPTVSDKQSDDWETHLVGAAHHLKGYLS